MEHERRPTDRARRDAYRRLRWLEAERDGLETRPPSTGHAFQHGDKRGSWHG